jgi:hypothetical protein
MCARSWAWRPLALGVLGAFSERAGSHSNRWVYEVFSPSLKAPTVALASSRPPVPRVCVQGPARPRSPFAAMYKSALALAALFAGASAFTPSFMGAAVNSRVAATRGPSMSATVEKSKSIPFLPRPENLDGKLAGDVGTCGSVRGHAWLSQEEEEATLAGGGGYESERSREAERGLRDFDGMWQGSTRWGSRAGSPLATCARPSSSTAV